MKYIYYICLLLFTNNTFSKPLPLKKIDLKVHKLREITQCDLVVSSGYRNKKDNARVGGAENSHHLRDNARDLIKTKQCKLSYRQIGRMAVGLFKGVIVYKTHVHVDMREGKSYYRL